MNTIFFLQKKIEHLFFDFLTNYSEITRFLFQKKTENLFFDFLLNYSKTIQFRNRIFLIVFFLNAFEISDFRRLDDDVENSKKEFLVIFFRSMNIFSFFDFLKFLISFQNRFIDFRNSVLSVIHFDI